MDEINELYQVWQTAKKKSTREKGRERLLKEIWKVYHPKLQVFLHSDPSCSQDEREDRASDLLLRVFESLPSYDRKLLFLSFYEGIKYREISLVFNDAAPYLY